MITSAVVTPLFYPEIYSFRSLNVIMKEHVNVLLVLRRSSLRNVMRFNPNDKFCNVNQVLLITSKR